MPILQLTNNQKIEISLEQMRNIADILAKDRDDREDFIDVDGKPIAVNKIVGILDDTEVPVSKFSEVMAERSAHLAEEMDKWSKEQNELAKQSPETKAKREWDLIYTIIYLLRKGYTNVLGTDWKSKTIEEIRDVVDEKAIGLKSKFIPRLIAWFQEHSDYAWCPMEIWRDLIPVQVASLGVLEDIKVENIITKQEPLSFDSPTSSETEQEEEPKVSDPFENLDYEQGDEGRIDPKDIPF